MWVARVLKRPVDKSDAPSLSRAEFKKLDSGGKSFVCHVGTPPAIGCH
jgi:hypothetical protein